MNRNAAGPEYQRPVGIAAMRGFVGQIAVFDHLHPAINSHQIAYFFQRIALSDRERRHFRTREQVVADQQRIANLHERIIDLEVKQVLDAAVFDVGQRAAFHQGRQHAAVAIGA